MRASPGRLLAPTGRPELAATFAAAAGAVLVFLALFIPLTAPVALDEPMVASVGAAEVDSPPATAAPEQPTATPVVPTIAAVQAEAPTATPTPLATATAAPQPSPTQVATATAAASPTRVVAAARPGAGVPILMYHYVRTNPDPRDEIGYGLSVTPELFAAHMGFLAERGYRVVPMRALHEYVGAGKLPGEKWAVLTFDDGYRDAYAEAWPVLKRHGFGATIYMIADLVENQRYLTKEQLRELSQAGVEIGSHSASHPDLPSLNAARLRHELVDSREALQRIVGGPVVSFCYPSGRNNAAVREAVRAAGYASAVTVEPGIFKGHEDRFQVPRVRVYGGMGLGSLARALGEPPPEAAKWPGQLEDRPYRRPR
jgi:peptidoglycan/xylan/chitin deacetylase (PgdA/CDA1 family)